MKRVQNPSTDSSVKGLTSMHRNMFVVYATGAAKPETGTHHHSNVPQQHTQHQATCTLQTCTFTEVTATTLKESTRSHLHKAVTTLQRRPKKHKPSMSCANKPTSTSKQVSHRPASQRWKTQLCEGPTILPRLNIRAVKDQEQPSSTTRCTCVGEG